MIDDFKRPPQRPPARLDNLQGTPPLAKPRPLQGTPSSSAPQTPRSTPTVAGPQPDRPSTPGPSSFNRSFSQYNKSPAAPSPAYQQPDPSRVPAIDSHMPLDTTPRNNFQPQTPQKKSRSPLTWLKNLSRKKKFALIVLSLLLLGGGGAAAFNVLDQKPAPAAPPKVAKPIPKPAPKPILSPLTGVAVTPEQQARPVTGVMIENSGNARPQSGLGDAGVVYEAISEYGITRFLAVYQESAPANIGPIRSVRPYFLDWIMPFDGALAHVGGSPEALQRIKDIGTKDIDQFHNAGAYHRISSRYAPHNMYSSMDALTGAAKARGYEKSTFTGFTRKAKEEPSKTPTAKAISLAISSAFYNVNYDYDPATNSYARTMGGAPHVDADTQARIQPKVVIALSMPYSVMANGYHSQYQTTGTGQAHFFQDGLVTIGSWSKVDHKSQFEFKDEAGKPVKLNPGQTWISVVGDPGKVTYTP